MLHCKIHCGIPGNRYLPMYREETGLGGQAAGWAGWHDPTLTRLTGDPGEAGRTGRPPCPTGREGEGTGRSPAMHGCLYMGPTHTPSALRRGRSPGRRPDTPAPLHEQRVARRVV